ncbi:hypothetical protein M2162_008900 [Streptomyces sp. SAI-041]|nr:hypothetical protein [Streptomyces sp. SAI-041]
MTGINTLRRWKARQPDLLPPSPSDTAPTPRAKARVTVTALLLAAPRS